MEIDAVKLMNALRRAADDFKAVSDARAAENNELGFQMNGTAALVLYGLAKAVGETILDYPDTSDIPEVPEDWFKRAKVRLVGKRDIQATTMDEALAAEAEAEEEAIARETEEILHHGGG